MALRLPFMCLPEQFLEAPGIRKPRFSTEIDSGSSVASTRHAVRGLLPALNRNKVLDLDLIYPEEIDATDLDP
ncbi:hypothetical protein FA13DRAFT_1732437 [Coprinellus micaceus]|uniref:Uncharacterized protein n=1 Tax=Coprinellus micaceus TaxID=71717 RepID=A0A4Y7TBP7_COPMI|nr:hypothetical protein FA13DRAFT_1732437 [Coprinellus micaceus]